MPHGDGDDVCLSLVHVTVVCDAGCDYLCVTGAPLFWMSQNLFGEYCHGDSQRNYGVENYVLERVVYVAGSRCQLVFAVPVCNRDTFVAQVWDLFVVEFQRKYLVRTV